MNHKTLCLTLSLTNLQKSFRFIHRSWFCTFLILYYLLSYPYLMLSTTHVLSNIENENLINNLSVPIYFRKFHVYIRWSSFARLAKLKRFMALKFVNLLHALLACIKPACMKEKFSRLEIETSSDSSFKMCIISWLSFALVELIHYDD